uniref:K1 capsule-specific polysaccharide lyase C-terminal domain-containing protein n=1 Tax=viral metagenome TaxID=1070528 RepID=A0A6C0EQH8_9ZZZZ
MSFPAGSFPINATVVESQVSVTYENVSGGLTVENGITTDILTVNGNTTLGNENTDVTTINGNLNISGNVGVTGNINLNGNLGVTGNTSLTGNLGVTGTTSLLGNLGVTGTTSLLGNLGVTGNTTLRGNLGVTGNTSLYGNLGVTGQTIMNGQTTISNKLILNNQLSGTATFPGSTTTVTVTTDKALTNSLIFLQKGYSSVTHLYVSAIVDGISFTITSTATETLGRTVQWMIVNSS